MDLAVRAHFSQPRTKNKISGPLNAEELREQHYNRIKKAQKDGDFKEEKLRLNLQENERDILEC